MAFFRFFNAVLGINFRTQFNIILIFINYKKLESISKTCTFLSNMESIQQTDLIVLKWSKENQKIDALRPRLTKHSKYFYNQRQNALIIYDDTHLYIINKQQMKNLNLGKQHIISELAYNLQKDVVVFLTVEGQLQAYFFISKTHITIKKDIKKSIYFDWVYGVNNIFQFFLADQKGITLYKVDEQKKAFKQVKTLSGKYNSFLYQPLTQTLVGFPMGDCKQVHTFVFHQNKYNNWFKLQPINISFDNDQGLMEKAKNQKSLGLDWSKNNKQLFTKNTNQTHFTNLIKINKRSFLLFFFAQEGLLKLIPISEQKQKQIQIKLPSDLIPDFCVVDNMLVVHLKAQKITFIYDLNGYSIQPLVSPFPIRHKQDKTIKNMYENAFICQKVIHTDGRMSKWQVQLDVIFNYLKNELQIFDFFIKRKQAKMNMLKWLRKDLFIIKQLNLSKFWKNLFMKYLSNIHPQNQVISLIDLFSNVFYTLSEQELISKQKLLNIILECLRQALQLKMNVPQQLQMMTFELLMKFKKYQTLVYLSHNQIIKDTSQILNRITDQYMNSHDMMLGTLAIDMCYRYENEKQMLRMLMKFQRVRDAKKYIKQNYQKIDLLYLIEVAKYIKNTSVLQEYLKYIKSFILQKYPTTNIAYLNQAEQKIFVKLNGKQMNHEATQQQSLL